MKHLLLIPSIILLCQSLNAQNMVAQAKETGDWGYVNLKGDFIIQPTYRVCQEFTEDGIAAVVDPSNKKGALIDVKGNRIPTEVADFSLLTGFFGAGAEGFTCGLLPVKVGKKWGYLNKEGKLAFEAKYDKVSGFYDCKAVAMMNKKWHILSSDGSETEVKDGSIQEVRDFKGGLAPFVASDKKLGFMDAQQKVVIPAQFNSVGYFSDGLAWAKDDAGKLGYIDKTGKWAITPQFDAGHNFDPSTGMARVKTAVGLAFIDKSGKLLGIPETETLGDFSDGLAKAKKGGQFGFVDKTGNWAIAPQFEGVRDFRNGHAAAKSGGKWGFIDQSGKWVIEPRFDGVKDFVRVK